MKAEIIKKNNEKFLILRKKRKSLFEFEIEIEISKETFYKESNKNCEKCKFFSACNIMIIDDLMAFEESVTKSFYNETKCRYCPLMSKEDFYFKETKKFSQDYSKLDVELTKELLKNLEKGFYTTIGGK